MNSSAGSAADTLGALSSDKAELLRLLVEKKSRHSQKISAYPRAQDASMIRLPASWAQQRLWFIDHLEGGSAAYHVPLALRLRGTLDVSALQRALDALVQRHETLRTVFVNEEGAPKQEITAEGRFVLQVFDVSGDDEASRESTVRRHALEESHGPFDLRAGPLIRGRLLRLGAAEHVLIVTMHHIVSDGWSLGVFMRELAALYSAYQEGRENPLAPLPVQYADYAQWQRGWLQGEALERQLDYWLTQLADAPPELDLPKDRPRPAARSYRGEIVPFRLDAASSARLREFAQRHELTLFMVLYAGWAVLLSRLSGQEDVVIGTPVANRQRPEVEALIGFIVNTLALRIAPRGEMSVRELFEQVKAVTLGAYDHQDVPFEQVVEALRPERSLNRSPVFQMMFTLQNAARLEFRLPGMTAAIEDDVFEYCKFDLVLSLEEQDEEIVGGVNYATDLFDRATIERWIACFKVLLKGMTEAADARIGELPILPEPERRRVIEEFNVTQAPYPQKALLHELFEAQVARAPQAVAVECEGRSLTYAELNARANQLARYLRSRGAGPDRLVGICVERSLEMVVGVLGILKAGGAYVPLDPSHPSERLQQLLKDAAPLAILTQDSVRQCLPPTTSRSISLDGQWDDIRAEDDTNLDPHAFGLTSRNLTYVIYTSGSTGRPKGVMIEHTSAVNFWQVLCRTTHRDYRRGARVGLNANYTFDMSLKGLLQLLSGHCLVLVPQAIRADGIAMLRFISEQRIDALDSTPSQLEGLLNAGLIEKCARPPTTVYLGGEPIGSEMWRVLKGSRSTHFFNMYGPTECTVDATIGSIRDSIDSPHIGKPIANTRIFILDTHLQPVPIGVMGEIYIGGAGVARGYLNRPELTAERFLSDRFTADPQARMYKTGDLGRWRVDGTLEYLGRNDDQVKIRGFRIELGEIEAQLAQHEKVKEAAIVAREDVPGERRLVAYVTPQPDSHPSVEALRGHLKTALPEYMIPSAFVVLESLPLTPNGKLDRRALPAPDLDAYVTRQYEPPQGEVEEILAGIWQELLKVERIGRHDSFFELGGHSLLIVQVLERLRRAGLSAEVRRVFQSPTLADLASSLADEAVGRIEVPLNLIPIGCESITPEMLPLVKLEPEHIERIVQAVPGGAKNIQDIYPLAPLQEGLLFHHLLEERSGDTYVVSMLLSLSSREKLDGFIAALQQVIDRHDVLRTAVLWEQLPQPVQVVCREATLPVNEIALDRDRDSIEQLKERMTPEWQRLDLRKAPLMRLQVAADQRSRQWYAVLRTHHLIFDKESRHTLLSEVMAHVEGRAATLPKPMPYRDHVAQVLAYARTHDAEAFFRGKLGEIDEPTAPFELLDVRGGGGQREEACQELEPELARRVRTQARRLGVSAAALLHAAWGLVVAATSGRDDIVFGTVLSGRLHGNAGAQRILGMFINTLPLRLRLRDVTAKELVEQTQRELVELLGHEQASLAIAQRCTGIVGSGPLFTTLLNYLHSTTDLEDPFSSRTGVSLLASRGGTNYPITLSVDDAGERFGLVVETDRCIDARRMVGYMVMAVRSLVHSLERSPQIPVSGLSILPESERRRVIEEFNATQAPYPQKMLLHELFEAQVVRAPRAVAVECEGQSLTYAELNARANQLAQYLNAKGVSPDQPVGLCLKRSLEMVVGMVGIWKAGGAYVPLDPDHPSERLAAVLEDAAPKVVLIQEGVRERVPVTTAEVIAIDAQWSEIARLSDDDLDAGALNLRSDHLAYAIYTSGSTGQPKAVLVEHRQVVSLWQGLEHLYRQSSPCERIGVNASLTFDASVQQLIQLLSGRTLVFVPQPVRWEAPALLHFIRAQRLDGIDCTPSQLRAWIDAGLLKEGAHRLRMVLVGGEPIDGELWRALAQCTTTDFYNVYGPTESTVDTTRACVKGDTSTPHIGRPMENQEVYLLDRHRQPVPIGVTGEIYIGGAGVARGYLNRPGLTAERFIADPFSTDPQARLYKSGDLGRWRADGTLEYLGRNDHQMKVRGVRIEPGEIETQLGRHRQVREAVVIAREDVPGEKRLVAYVTLQDDSSLSAEELRSHLKAILPEYMVPSVFVVLECLPLTPNGKLDRRALPTPEFDAYVSGPYESPQGKVEEILAGIWQELLKVERVGRHDNFFDLGGHSLNAMRVVAGVAAQLSLTLPVAALFQHPTIQQLAAIIEFLLVYKEERISSGGMELEEGVIGREPEPDLSLIEQDAQGAKPHEAEGKLAGWSSVRAGRRYFH